MSSLKENGSIDKNIVTFKLDHPNGNSTMTIGGEDSNERSSDFT